MQLGVRVAYPERGQYDWFEALNRYPAVEVAFRDPDWFVKTNVYEKFHWPWVQGLATPKVLSIHLPHVRITNKHAFWITLDKAFRLARIWDATRLVIHPTNATVAEGLACYEDVFHHFLPAFRATGTYLCWETFLSKRRFVNTIESIANARFELHACYDTSHMRRDTLEVGHDLFNYKDTIKVVHLSNWNEHGQHLPLKQGVLDMCTILRYLGKNFLGPVILEYLPEYHHLYLDDMRWAWEEVLK